ncbi:MAG: hypothetical protein DKM50_01055 [Candidatus Margulisiibacteriota bacterium]|nr:MAG: hypothetical protein A2X43_08120 [Candidatus Margulisbacteria bacterium GWD2_39_127]OGI01658.1 MAG: hypothetical protein A2X42_04860 [Candidatus Margulisbacteria bacterium GWF2_38_17]OGI05867.1 MAG: hypothetical protein A2X41_04515 [Candidatus Margulisbacteria bacterium GWE2_39_32]PZM83861.1 MAG: hypothetical protein DKM50_01055 [Candidatus Margulisiibacteriota bacterium]HAR63623.1 hypothetical protein [Candidatus Margulisiibacteriota bacterium]
MEKIAYGVAVIVSFIILLIFFSPVTIINPGERGIMVTLGKASPVILGEGVNLKLPLIQKIIKLTIKTETARNSTLAFSSDLQTLKVEYAILFNLPENKLFDLYTKYSGNVLNSFVTPRLEESLKTITAKYTAEDFVRNRGAVKEEVYTLLKEKVSGVVNLNDFNITNIDLSDELEAAIERKQVEQQRAKQKEYELQSALKEKEITIVQAQAEAESVRIKGNALANSPRVIELEVVKKWNGVAPTTVVTGGGGSSIILPLGK